MGSPYEVTPLAVKARLSDGKKATLIDVREPEECALARVEGAELIPMGSVPAEFQKLERLSDSGDLLILCHHGVRSLQVTMWLRAGASRIATAWRAGLIVGAGKWMRLYRSIEI